MAEDARRVDDDLRRAAMEFTMGAGPPAEEKSKDFKSDPAKLVKESGPPTDKLKMTIDENEKPIAVSAEEAGVTAPKSKAGQKDLGTDFLKDCLEKQNKIPIGINKELNKIRDAANVHINKTMLNEMLKGFMR